jgi:hypothetical protein
MSDTKPPPQPSRPRRGRAGAAAPVPAPDPADQGTAYGMELSMGVSDAAGKRATTTPDDDPLHWIRRWLDRHTPR